MGYKDICMMEECLNCLMPQNALRHHSKDSRVLWYLQFQVYMVAVGTYLHSHEQGYYKSNGTYSQIRKIGLQPQCSKDEKKFPEYVSLQKIYL